MPSTPEEGRSREVEASRDHGYQYCNIGALVQDRLTRMAAAQASGSLRNISAWFTT